MKMKDVRALTVTYADGTEETFDPIRAFHRESTNYARGAKTPDEGWTEHEIRWSERGQ